MRDPYEVLGIPKGSSQEEIKAAYKKLVKKYHPDQYANNPLSDLAQEKLKEINQAYDNLIGGSQKSSSQNYQKSQSHGYQKKGQSDYYEIRTTIERGNLSLAENMLNSIIYRDAEWNYLMGIVYLRKGWYDQSYQYINLAASMNPGNMEYRNALNNFNFRNQGYRTHGNQGGYRMAGGSCCDTCSCLICSDCCCEAMGGDLINCC
jgi:molecular chaperone DnaJ